MASNRVFCAADYFKYSFRAGVLVFLLVFCGKAVSAEPVNINLVADYLSKRGKAYIVVITLPDTATIIPSGDYVSYYESKGVLDIPSIKGEKTAGRMGLWENIRTIKVRA